MWSPSTHCVGFLVFKQLYEELTLPLLNPMGHLQIIIVPFTMVWH